MSYNRISPRCQASSSDRLNQHLGSETRRTHGDTAFLAEILVVMETLWKRSGLVIDSGSLLQGVRELMQVSTDGVEEP